MGDCPSAPATPAFRIRGYRIRAKKTCIFYKCIAVYAYTLYTYIFFYILHEKSYPLILTLDIAGAEDFFYSSPIHIRPYPILVVINKNVPVKRLLSTKEN